MFYGRIFLNSHIFKTRLIRLLFLLLHKVGSFQNKFAEVESGSKTFFLVFLKGSGNFGISKNT